MLAQIQKGRIVHVCIVKSLKYRMFNIEPIMIFNKE